MTESVNFDRAVDYYDTTRGFISEIRARVGGLLMQAGSLTDTSRVLEIGVGTGRIALTLAPHIRQYIGVDISRGMMATLHTKSGGDAVDLVEGDITRMPLPDASCDAIIENHVLHLVPDYATALEEAARVLKPDGVFLRGRGRRPRLHIEGSSQRRVVYGLRDDDRAATMEERGWQVVVEYSIRAPSSLIPRAELENIEARRWSSLWLMDDTDFQAYAAHARRHIEATYDDLDQPQPAEAGYHVAVWRRTSVRTP